MDLSKLKEKRKERGWTQWDLAKKLEVSPPTVRLWEREMVEPNPENKKKLEEVFGE